MATLNHYVPSKKPSVGFFQCGIGVSVLPEQVKYLENALSDCKNIVRLSSPSHVLDLEKHIVSSYQHEECARIELWAVDVMDALELLWIMDAKADYYIDH